MNVSSTIRVTGEAELNVPPDLMIVSACFSCKSMEYSTSVRQLAATLEEMKAALERKGIMKDRVRARQLQVENAYEYRNRERRFTGFEASQTILLRLPVDHVLLSSVIEASFTVDVRPVLRLWYEIEDRHLHQSEALKSAFADARQKANALAESSGGNLKAVTSIDSTSQRVELDTNEAELSSGIAAEKGPLKLPEVEPLELQIKARVNVEWGLES